MHSPSHTSKMADRTSGYETLVKQVRGLVDAESDFIANLANTAAAITSTFDFHWVGWYLVKEQELVLGPFQGPVACTRIALGRGVCGTSWKENKALLVPNVHEFPGHIACSDKSLSELVIPIEHQGNVIGVLDLDSDRLDDFTEVDLNFLKQIVSIVASGIPS